LGAEIRKAQEPNERLWRGTESLRVSDLQMNAWTWRVYDTVKARLQVVIAKVPHVQICDLLSHHIISYHIIWICYGAPIRSSEAPVRQRVDFKLALLVYKALHDTTAAYLVDDCQLVSHHGRRRLRSADIDTCYVARTNTRFGDRSFAAAGPRLWNSLPAGIRQPDNDTGEFCQLLKAFLFKLHCGA